jgi:hypothetical protein
VPDPLADLACLPGVPSAVAAATAAVDAVLRDRGLRLVENSLRVQALLAGAEASASLTDDPNRWRPGARRLAAELTALAGLIRVAPAQALARAHAVVARGLEPDDQLGRVNDDPVIARRMGELSQLLATPTAAPAVVLAAVVHAEIATLGAFGAASGLVARGAEHLVLLACGLDPYGVVVVEAGHAADPAGYRAGLAGYANGGVPGVSGWIIQCAAAAAHGAELSPVAGTAARASGIARPRPGQPSEPATLFRRQAREEGRG